MSSIHDSAQKSTSARPLLPGSNVVWEDDSEDFELELPAWLGGRQPTDADKAAALFPLNPFKFITMTGYDKNSGKKDTVTGNSPPTSAMLEQHLSTLDAVGSLGYLPGGAHETTVACVDIDLKDKTADAFHTEARAIEQALRRHGVAFNTERSTNGGRHLWVFLSEPLPHAEIRAALKTVATEAGFPGVEVFPKGGATSNPIFLPYRGASAAGDEGLGRTFLEHPDGVPIPLSRVLDEVRLTPAEVIRSLAARTNAKAPTEVQPTQTADLDPAGFERLKEAALNPPAGFQRHKSIEAFLNVAERMSRQAEMADFLKSSAVFDAWVTDGTRTPDAWAAEIDRWQAGQSTHQLGITSLIEQGWQIPDLPKLGQPAERFRGRQSWQQDFEALRLKYAPVTDAQGEKRRIRRYRAHEVRNIPQLQPLVGNLLVRQTLAALLGPSGAGKSMLGLDLALHVATGRDWREHEVSQGAVVWLAAESMEYTANRMEAWCNLRGVAPESMPFDLLDGYLSLTDVQPNGGLEELILTLKESEEERGPLALIVVDTVARTFGDGDENSNDDMKKFTDAAELLTRIFNATVLLIHHTGKDTSRGGRGASAFKAPLTTELVIEKNKNGVVKVSQSKNRGAADDGKPIELSFQSHSWEEDGVERSAGVVAEGVVAAGVVTGRGLLTPQQTTILEVLEELCAEAEVPIKRADWKQACEEQDVAARRFNEGLKSLLEAGVVREVVPGKTFEPVEADEE